MELLWQRKAATVHELVEALPKKLPLAYNSVLTTIRILERKGYVRHAKTGRAHVYEPQVDRANATRFEIRNLVSRFFHDSQELLVLNILEERVDAEELDRLRNLLLAAPEEKQ
jgi:BlaI family transcriptional regulator, penicillinase repressor